MKRQIREGVWETNSSSVHALSIDPSGMRKNHLKMKKGYVITDFGQFGKEDELYDTQDAKLSYLMTELFYLNHYLTDGIEDMYQFKYIEEAIMDYDPKVLGIKLLKKQDPEIDHQSQPESYESNFVNYWDKLSIQEFLFNKYIRFTTGCD